MTFHDRGTSWFLAQLKPNCANIADKNLKRQGFQTFLPMEEETRSAMASSSLPCGPCFPATSSWPSMWPAGSGDGQLDLWHHAAGELRQRADGRAAGSGLAADAALRREGQVAAAKALEARGSGDADQGTFANFVAEVEQIAPDRRVWVLMEIMGGRPGSRSGRISCGPCNNALNC